ncbi:DUF3883 domain-containing protein [Hymenobacter sp. 15J16-1T3B]|uniref:protein NO VEIN domain-containing protein n=1 Tax=Hymenobacter sp. 15J16-1T3B TaxID=2886941 RepID=UPI001D119C24|nr:DUF3883 domain-containing protein [Hymenobacter sp. 15J16-1T3B]MCC3158655.1 DUF3883 domain-containing protein [Hymenobacter sp. 15J16-1T3B]
MHGIIFFNTGWMNRYAGPDNDTIQGGGRFVEENESGGEMYNFKPHRNTMYGYVQPVRGNTINITRLGAATDDDTISDVTVVWTARHPVNGGTYVVGWYTSATVHREYQELDFTRSSTWNWNGREVGYHATASQKTVRLLTPDARTLLVPRGKGGMGQSNVWYADDNPQFVKQVLNYIQHYNSTGLPPTPTKRTKAARQLDVLKRVVVEQKAVEMVRDHYTSLGYTVDSVEKDNVGWDLEAVSGKSLLKLEVKGLSGPDVVVELTRNEYKNLKADPGRYRLCVVTKALTAPQLHVFTYLQETDQWVDADGFELAFEEIVSARVHIK